MLVRRTGDSRRAPGLSPGGAVRHGDREIGSLAGDIILYLAPFGAPKAGILGSGTRNGSEGASCWACGLGSDCIVGSDRRDEGGSEGSEGARWR